MIGLKTFRKGGIHPKENKLSNKSHIENLPLPTQAIVPLSQHIGAPSQPVVNKGDQVKTGMLIAKSGGFVSANLHSPVSGTVVKIDKHIDASGYKRDAIFIKVEGDEWEEQIDTTDNFVSSDLKDSKEIIEKIANAGIVGLGGATFPTQVKLMPPPGTKAEVVIINAAECEPYLTADHMLMLEKTEEILEGISLLMRAVNVSRAIVGIENNKKDAIEKMKRVASEKYPSISIQALKARYPQGGEKQLVAALLKKEIKSGSLPISVGAVVQNVGTAFAVYEAIVKNKPLIERIVTVTGKEVKKVSNLRVRIGTQISELIDYVGGLPEDCGKIISGGPMMGKALSSAEVPVCKGTSGVLMLPDFESKRKKMRDCIRCAKCLHVCPMGLNPTSLMNHTMFQMWPDIEADRVTDCIECGSCSYTCPSDRPLLDYIRLGKSTVISIIKTRKN